VLFKQINEAVNSFVWGVPMLALIIGAGVYLSFRTGFIQIFKFGFAMKNTFGKAFKKQKVEAGAVTPFQAMTTALAATVGTANIAGVTSAVTLGGAGALFWMWVSALIGMCTKYAEVVLAMRFRERNKAGEWVGGPMYYIKNGLGGRYRWLADAFCIFGAVAALGSGNAVQVGNMTGSINRTVVAFIPSASGKEGTISLVIGLVVAVLTALTLFGGVKRIGRVTEMIVPFMAVVYITAALAVIIAHSDAVAGVFGQIFSQALTPGAVAGGAAGISVRTALSWGFRRGVFSNEAGLGSAPIAHASSSETKPVVQGMYGIFEVFLDTIVICTITGLTLLVSGVGLNFGTYGSVALNIEAFATVFGEKLAGLILSAGLSMFALATVFGWSLYGMRCVEFLFGSRSVRVYQVLYVAVTVVGATMELESIWQVADTLNGLMAIPNLIALFALSGVVVKLTREHFDNEERLKSRGPVSKRTRRL
jgi:AGCS family alanine or glycine:cation symporter